MENKSSSLVKIYIIASCKKEGKEKSEREQSGSIKSVEIVSHRPRVMVYNANNNDFRTVKRLNVFA